MAKPRTEADLTIERMLQINTGIFLYICVQASHMVWDSNMANQSPVERLLIHFYQIHPLQVCTFKFLEAKLDAASSLPHSGHY